MYKTNHWVLSIPHAVTTFQTSTNKYYINFNILCDKLKNIPEIALHLLLSKHWLVIRIKFTKLNAQYMYEAISVDMHREFLYPGNQNMECIVARKIYICTYMCEVTYVWYNLLYYVFGKEKNWSLMLTVKKTLTMAWGSQQLSFVNRTHCTYR